MKAFLLARSVSDATTFCERLFKTKDWLLKNVYKVVTKGIDVEGYHTLKEPVAVIIIPGTKESKEWPAMQVAVKRAFNINI